MQIDSKIRFFFITYFCIITIKFDSLCLCRASASFRGDLSGFVLSSATFRDVLKFPKELDILFFSESLYFKSHQTVFMFIEISTGI